MTDFVQLTSVTTSGAEAGDDSSHIAAVEQVRKRWGALSQTIRNNREKTAWRAVGMLLCPRCCYVEFPGCQEKLLHQALLEPTGDIGAVHCTKCSASTDDSSPWGVECRSCHGPKVRPEMLNISKDEVKNNYEAARKGQRDSQMHVALLCPDCLTIEFVKKWDQFAVLNSKKEICYPDVLEPLPEDDIGFGFTHFLDSCKSKLQRIPVRLSYGEAEYCWKNHSDTELPTYQEKGKTTKDWSGSRWWTKSDASEKRVLATSGQKKYEEAWNIVTDRILPFQDMLFKFLDEDGSQGLDHSEMASGLAVLLGVNQDFRSRGAFIAKLGETLTGEPLNISTEEIHELHSAMYDDKYSSLFDSVLNSAVPSYFDGAVSKEDFLVHLVETIIRLSDTLSRAFVEMRSGKVVTVRRASVAVSSDSKEELPVQGPLERAPRFNTLGLSVYSNSADPEGLVVMSVQPGKAADKAGIKKGDRILSVLNTPTNDVHTYIDAVSSEYSKNAMPIRYRRDGKSVDLVLVCDGMYEFGAVLQSALAHGGPRPSIVGSLDRSQSVASASAPAQPNAALLTAPTTPPPISNVNAEEAAKFNRFFYTLFEAILFDNVHTTLGIPGPIPEPSRNFWAWLVGVAIAIAFLPFIILYFVFQLIRVSCCAGFIGFVMVLIALPFYYVPAADLTIYFGWVNNMDHLSFHELAGPITFMSFLALLILGFAPDQFGVTNNPQTEKEIRRKLWNGAKFEFRRRRIVPNWLTTDKISGNSGEQFPNFEDIKESDSAFRLPHWLQWLILIAFAVGHSLTPGFIRIAAGKPFLAYSWAEQTIAVMNIVVCIPLIIIFGYLCKMAWKRAYQIVVVNDTIAQYTNPDEAQAHGLKCFLDLSRSDHLEFWLFFREYTRQNQFVSFRWVLVLIGSTLLIDVSMLIAVIVQVIIGGDPRSFNIVAVIDVVILSAFLMSFLLVVVRANISRQEHVECLEKVKFVLARRVNFIREEHDKLLELHPEAANEPRSTITVAQRRALGRVAFNKASRFPAAHGSFTYRSIEAVNEEKSESTVVLGELQISSSGGRRCTAVEYERERQVAVDCLRLVEAAITQLKLDDPISILSIPVDREFVLRMGSLVVAGVSAGLTKILQEV